MTLRRWLNNLLSCERGNAIMIAAAAMPLVIGAAAIGVDTIQLTLSKRHLQRAADAGALAGAYAVVQSKPAAAAVDRDLTLNNKIPLSVTRVVENAPTTGSYSGDANAVRVVLTAQRTSPFMQFFNRSAPIVKVEATAAVVYAGKFCMVSLETGNTTGVTFTGSTDIDLGCGVATNATGSAAISAGGSSRIVASPIAAIGGVPSSSSYATGTKLLPYSPKQVDPFATLPVPAPPSGCNTGTLSVQPNQSNAAAAETSTNVICYASMNIKGTINFGSDKTIYVAGGTLSFGAQADVTCTRCTFILTGPPGTTATAPTASPIATIDMHGNAVLTLTSPSTGTYKDLLMYQDPRATIGNGISINGNSSTTYQGGFYFPKAYMTFNGNTGMHTTCLQLVARRLTFSGNSSVSNVCDPANGGGKDYDAIFIRLVA